MEDLQPMPSQVDPGQMPSGIPQGTDSGTQVPVQSQPSTVQQVEPNATPSSQDDARKASDFETARQLKRLARDFQSLKQVLERNANPAPIQSSSQTQVNGNLSPISKDDLINDPVGAIQRMLEQNNAKTREEIMRTFEQREMVNQIQRAEQDAVKLIKTNELYKRDPEGEERIHDILTEPDEDGSSLQDEMKKGQLSPIRAAKMALEIYKSRYGQTKVTGAPTKAQMISTATAVNAGGGKSTLEQEALQIGKELELMPELRNDPAFKAKLAAFAKKAEMEKRLGTR